jgi:glycosyltransferase involved in cell wall biosynthesis
MVTTFFGAESFGGDASYVHRLSAALARHGHDVHVVHSADSFRTVRGDVPLRPQSDPPGVVVHRLSTRLGPLSPLWTHQTGRAGLEGRWLERLFEEQRFDVVNFHNVSLLGGPDVLRIDPGAGAVKLLSVHDYWLVCPLHVLWKLDRRVCERPQCIRCTARAGRPPQLWRYTGLLERATDHVDAVICPSRHAAEVLRRRGVDAPLFQLPFHLPGDWAGPQTGRPPASRRHGSERPYFAAAGRLVKEKGFQTAIAAVREVPGVELRIAGAGPYERELRELAADRPEVRFLGLLGAPELAALFRGARAVVVPSLYMEPFGYVVLEALSVGTPVIASRNGALPELVESSRGGLLFDDQRELRLAMSRLAVDDELGARLGERGRSAVASVWSESRHLERYLGLIEDCGAAARRPFPPRVTHSPAKVGVAGEPRDRPPEILGVAVHEDPRGPVPEQLVDARDGSGHHGEPRRGRLVCGA